MITSEKASLSTFRLLSNSYPHISCEWRYKTLLLIALTIISAFADALPLNELTGFKPNITLQWVWKSLLIGIENTMKFEKGH